jgi:Sap, sulfolipid-1-addressing protein
MVMWGSVVVLALPIALDPVRLGVNLLLVSRPRPAQNLLVYWAGCVLASVLLLLVPILVLHFTPTFSSFVHDLANPATTASSTVRQAQIVMGVLALSVAALLAARRWRRQRAPLPSGDTGTSTLLADHDAPNPISRLLTRGDAGQQPDGRFGSGARRLLGRAQDAWESGALWVAFVIGFWAGPNPSLVIFALTTILTSGAAIGMQIAVAAAFVVETLAVVEIVLVSNLVSPAKTQAFLRVLHDWVRARRRQVLAAMLALIGVALVAQGTGIL